MEVLPDSFKGPLFFPRNLTILVTGDEINQPQEDIPVVLVLDSNNGISITI